MTYNSVKLLYHRLQLWLHMLCLYSWASQGGAGGAKARPWILKSLAKKVFFSIFRGKKQISPLLAPAGKNPSDTHDYIALNICFFIISNLARRCFFLNFRYWFTGASTANLVHSISFGEMASDEIFTNFSMAPSFFFDSSFLAFPFFLKNIHFLLLSSFAGCSALQTVKILLTECCFNCKPN